MVDRENLLDNYGFTQNASSLSTLRDYLMLVPEKGSISHPDLREAILDYKSGLKGKRDTNTWDARCKIKGLHALALIGIDRQRSSYFLTDLGRELQQVMGESAGNSSKWQLNSREREILMRGMLSNPPLIRVLRLLYEKYRADGGGLSKYEIGGQLGFVGEEGFTHFDEEWIIANRSARGSKEGSSDKYARTYCSWLKDVDLVRTTRETRGVVLSDGQVRSDKVQVYVATEKAGIALQTQARSIERLVPIEMLASSRNPFHPQLRLIRATVLEALKAGKVVDLLSLAQSVRNSLIQGRIAIALSTQHRNLDTELANMGVDASYIETVVIQSLRMVGFDIQEQVPGYYCLNDKVQIDYAPPTLTESYRLGLEGLEAHVKRLRDDCPDVPLDLIRQLWQYSTDSSKSAPDLFESVVDSYFRELYLDTAPVGMYKGRTGDVLVKYTEGQVPQKKYGVVVDAKVRTDGIYDLPASDRRAMTEYLITHFHDFLEEDIARHAFMFFAHSFTNAAETHLDEITNETTVKGSLLGVEEAVYLAQSVRSRKISLLDLYERVFTLGRRVRREDIP